MSTGDAAQLAPEARQMDATTDPGTGNEENEVLNVYGDNNGEDVLVTTIDDGGSGQDSIGDDTKDDFDFLWSLRKYLVLLGILAVTMTYNSGLTPPGGFWNKIKDGHQAGDPALHVEFSQRYEIFFYCNATAFAASIVLIILLLSKTVTKKKLWLRAMQFTMLVDLFSLMGAYASGSCRAFESSMYTWVLVIIVFAYVWIHILVSTRIVPETLKKKAKMMVDKALSKLGIPDVHLSSRQEKKDLGEAHKFILMLVTFAATVTYQAGLSPPGGFWAENDYISGSSPPYIHRPSTPVLRTHYLHRYNIFVSCNSTSFVTSLVTIILLLSRELSRHGIRSKAVAVCVVADLVCLIVAYAAGCCRDVATSFYVIFIIFIVFICIAILVGIFAYEPVAEWLQKIKSRFLRCTSSFLSSKFGSTRSSNADREGSNTSYRQTSVHGTGAPAENSASEPGLQPAVNQEVLNTIEMDSVNYPPEDNKETKNSEESFPKSLHTSVNSNSPRSANDKELVSNLEHQSTDHQLVSNMNESRLSTEHPSLSHQETLDTTDAMTADRQQAAALANLPGAGNDLRPSISSAWGGDRCLGAAAACQAATKQPLSTHESTSGQCVLDGDYNGVTNDSIEDGSPSLPVKVSGIEESAEEHNLISYNNTDIENGGIESSAEHENGHIDGNQETSEPNCIKSSAEHENGHIDGNQETSEPNSAEEHLEKTRTYLLLLAILAVSLTYQSGLNPPGGFWSRRKKNHLIGDRILEDSDHPRFISFFYLNAIAFVASIVIIIMLLDKSISKKVTKHRVLQIAMIVDLLSLTGAFVLGSSRDAKRSISISALLFLVLAYVALHVRIAIHVIPLEWKRQVTGKIKCFLCGNMRSALPWLSHKQKDKEISPKELERRRNLLLTLAILAATVTYQAGINPPGGVWSDDKGVSGMPGNPILQDIHPRRYDVFYYSNSVSFVSSVAITILLLNKESFEHGIKSYALRVCLVVGLLGLLVAYAAGSCRNRKQSIFVTIIAVAVLISLVVQVLLSSMHNTLGRPLAQLMECLQKLMEYLQGRFFHTGKRQIISELLEIKDPDKKIARKRHKYLMLIATLAASVTYQAGLNPPGGFWSDDKRHHGHRHNAGDPVLHDINHRRYKTFFCFNSISFMASIVVIMLLLSKSIRKKDVPLEVLLLIMILDLLSLMTAFAAGSCRKFSTSIYIFGLVAGVVIYLVVLIVLSKAIKTCLRKWKTSGVFSYRRPERV